MLHSIAKKGKLQGETSLFLGMIETVFLAYTATPEVEVGLVTFSLLLEEIVFLIS